MGKFKPALKAAIREEKEYEQKQAALKERHHIEDENIVVVEQKSLLKFVIKALIAAVKTLAAICLLSLAAVGTIAIIYPTVRAELFNVIVVIVSDVKNMVM